MKLKNSAIKISSGKQYLFSTLLMFLIILALYFVQELIGYQTVSLILLLIIFLLPLFNFDTGPIVLSAVISALGWDYYFIPPHFTMHIASTEDAVMLFMFFFVAVTNGVLTAKLKDQGKNMEGKERMLGSLYKFVKDLSSAVSTDELFAKIIRNIYEVFRFNSVIYMPGNNGSLNRNPYSANNFKPDEMEWLAAETAYKEKTKTGSTTGIVQGAEALYVPLINDNSVLCVIGIKLNERIKSSKEEISFLENFLNEIIPFLERKVVKIL